MDASGVEDAFDAAFAARSAEVPSPVPAAHYAAVTAARTTRHGAVGAISDCPAVREPCSAARRQGRTRAQVLFQPPLGGAHVL
ncbi:hypothetical protein GCM10011578_050250 [Streptomyces fuscichromogenes]|uniref:Uncharacterized protein n=1 Tax=Streptomyces fuscichromogenes TaxID=1324013 RepID=A0A918CTB9_9ACTN|nr:hypothetical protein GCM10011578_050250 [Streptomyces fuscichromogenes]